MNVDSKLAAELCRETYSDQPSLANYEQRKDLRDRLESGAVVVVDAATVRRTINRLEWYALASEDDLALRDVETLRHAISMVV